MTRPIINLLAIFLLIFPTFSTAVTSNDQSSASVLKGDLHAKDRTGNEPIAKDTKPLSVIVEEPPIPGQRMPKFKTVTSTGIPISFDKYEGSVLLVDFFAPWSQACRNYIPQFNSLYNKFGKQGLQVIGVNVDDDSTQDLKKYAYDNIIRYPLTQADENALVTFGIKSVPMILVVDKKGNISEVFKNYSYDQTGYKLEKLILKLLKEQ